MLVRRGAARLATVCALLAGLVVAGAAPALADDEVSVRLSSSSSFTAGGTPGSVNVAVSKRSDGCVSVRTGVALQMSGLSADDVTLLVAVDGSWQPVAMSGDGTLRSARSAPEKPELCDRKSVTMRYKLALAAGVPAGRINVVGEAYAAGGDLLKQDAESRKVNGAKVTPTPSRTSASPSPTPEETLEAEEPEVTEAAVAAPTGQPGLGAGAGGDGGGGIGSMVMVVGVGMVAIGIALLVLLLRRARGGGREEPGAGGMPPGGGPRPPYPPGGGVPTVYGARSGEATTVIPRGGEATTVIPRGGDATTVIPGGGDSTTVIPRGGDSTVIMPRVRP
ncbi:hypothetical protein ACI2K4_11510 [Micromonospora sp. NPDC050397]|uniref:hypothetical protein n=1 Tax=Micromonospora sp. NPDC050397 TaxID=3364279 RepID=UPI00384C8371